MRHKIIPMLLTSVLFIVMFAFITPLGHAVEWSPEMRLTWDYEIDALPSITQTSDGRIWVVWQSYRTGNYEVFYKVYNASSVHPWSPDTRLTNDTATDYMASIMQAQDGKIWVAWVSNRMGNDEIHYKTYDGSTWSAVERLTTNSSRDRYPSIMQAINGTIWVVWATNRNGNYEIYYKTSSDNGETWREERLTNYTGRDWQPSVMQAADERIWVVWSRNGGDDNIYYTVYNGTSWSPEDTVTTDPDGDSYPSLMQAADGAIWVVWDSDRSLGYNVDLYYNIYNGSWLGDTRLTSDGDFDSGPSILQAIDGTIWIAWYSSRTGMDIYYMTDSIPDENDVAIFSVAPDSATVAQGENASIEVVAQNKGTLTQTFQVSCYANLTLIGVKTIQVTPGQLYPTAFIWNTTSATPGPYVLWGEASTVAGETYTDDNLYTDGIVTILFHDVAVENVTTSQTIAHKGYTVVDIYVDVRNEGDFSETFQVTAYYDGTAISTYMVTNLASKDGITLIFHWNTGVPYSNYTISAKASQVPGEFDLADNSRTDGNVFVTVPGDVNGDGAVNDLDLSGIDNKYGDTPSTSQNWDPACDINGDGVVDVFDLFINAKNYGNTT